MGEGDETRPIARSFTLKPTHSITEKIWHAMLEEKEKRAVSQSERPTERRLVTRHGILSFGGPEKKETKSGLQARFNETTQKAIGTPSGSGTRECFKVNMDTQMLKFLLSKVAWCLRLKIWENSFTQPLT